MIKTTTARVQIQICCVETDDNNDDNDNNSNNAIDEDVNDHNNKKTPYICIYIYAYVFFEEAVFNFGGCSTIAHFKRLGDFFYTEFSLNRPTGFL